VRFLAFAGAERSRAYPSLVTVAESGVPGYDYGSWIALFAVKGTPPDVGARLRGAAEKAMASAGLAERFEKSGLEIWDQTPDRLASAMREDWKRWESVVRSAKLAQE